MAYKIFQTSFKFLPNPKYTLKILSKTYKILPKWRNFAKSGHTACHVYLLQEYRHLAADPAKRPHRSQQDHHH